MCLIARRRRSCDIDKIDVNDNDDISEAVKSRSEPPKTINRESLKRAAHLEFLVSDKRKLKSGISGRGRGKCLMGDGV